MIRLSPATVAALVVSAALAGCVASGPDARRAAYLDCARKQGVPVERGTIQVQSQAHWRALGACEALPR